MFGPDLGDGPLDGRLVHRGGRPFARVQDDPAHQWPMPHLADLPPATRAIDAFPGERGMPGRSHAARRLRAGAEALLAAGSPPAVIDPGPADGGAARARRRAGFAGDRIAPCEHGDPVIVMEFRRS